MRKDGTCQLLCKVSIDAEWEQIGTKVSVNPDIWNPEKGRANGRSANAVIVNRAIDELTEEITGHYNRIKNSLGFITAELVKNAVMGVGLKPLPCWLSSGNITKISKTCWAGSHQGNA